MILTRARLRVLLALVAWLLVTGGTVATAYAQGSTAVLGEGGPRDQRRGGRPRGGAAGSPDVGDAAPTLKQGPLQRLEPGALLCRTEAALEQHEAAVQARLNGGDAPASTGCHIVQVMTPVSVLERHGPARTQVKAGDQLGWTDTLIRNP